MLGYDGGLKLTDDGCLSDALMTGVRQRNERRHSRSEMSVALYALIISFVGLAWFALYTEYGRRVDEIVMLATYNRSRGGSCFVDLLEVISPGTSVLLLAGLVFLALINRRKRDAVSATVLFVGTNMTTQLLKRFVLHRPSPYQAAEPPFGSILPSGHVGNSLPSGHTTAIFSLVLAALLVVPLRLRFVTCVLGTVVAALVGWMTIVVGWHRPSDVAGGVLITLIWFIGISVLTDSGCQRRPGVGLAIFCCLGGALLAAGMTLLSTAA